MLTYLGTGYAWPAWSYLPSVAVAAALADQVGLTDRGPGLLDAVMPLTALGAWLPGRIAVRFDPDLLAEVVSTPLDGELPVELLERLPAWGLYLDAPHLGPGVGVMACLEPQAVRRPTGEVLSDDGTGTELWLIWSLPELGPRRLVACSLWIGAGSIEAALTTQDRERRDQVDEAKTGRWVLEKTFDQPYQDAIRSVVAMLLYLCSADPDLTRRHVPGQRRTRPYYERGREAGRLAGEFSSGPLELARTQELILRHLPPSPLEILDVGGGPGVYATWLTARSDRVRLVDPVARHVEHAQARDSRISARIGDARQRAAPDAGVDVVLLLGPLYHLTSQQDRLRALGETYRVRRPGGWLFAAAISRWGALLDLLVRLDRFHEAEVPETVRAALGDGVFRGHRPGLFTTAYLRRPADLADEVTDVGFTGPVIYNIEGPGFLVTDFAARWADPAGRDALLEAARLVETEADPLGASSHLLTVGQRPARTGAR